MPGRSTSGFDRHRQAVLAPRAKSDVRCCSASRMKGELHPTSKNRRTFLSYGMTASNELICFLVRPHLRRQRCECYVCNCIVGALHDENMCLWKAFLDEIFPIDACIARRLFTLPVGLEDDTSSEGRLCCRACYMYGIRGLELVARGNRFDLLRLRLAQLRLLRLGLG